MGSRQDYSDKEFARELQDTIVAMARKNDAMDELDRQASKDKFNNNLFDSIVDDAKILYLVYLDSKQCRDYSEKRVFQTACEAAVLYAAALIADDDDDIYNSLRTGEATTLDNHLVLGDILKEYRDEMEDDDRRPSRSRDRDGRRGGGRSSSSSSSSRGRDRDRDDDRDSRGGHSARNSDTRGRGRGRSERSSIRGGSVGRSGSVSRHLDNIENASSTEQTQKGNDNVRAQREPREPREVEVAPKAAVNDVFYLPFIDAYAAPFDAKSKKPWATIFHADTQIPLYLATDKGMGAPDVVEDVVLELTNPEVIKMKNIPIPQHQTHLLFRRRDPNGYGGDASNMHEFENRLKQPKDESLDQVYSMLEREGDTFRAIPGSQLPGVFSRKMITVPEIIDASGWKDKVWAMVNFMDSRIRAIDSSASCEDYLSMATVEIDADMVISVVDQKAFESFESIVQRMRMANSYHSLAACMVELANIIPRRIWNVINDDMTAYVLEILEVEFALVDPTMDSFTNSIDSLVDALDSAYGRAVSEHFSDTAVKLIANCMQFTPIPDTLSFRHYRMETVVMMPLVAEDVDYALAIDSGIGLVSKELMPGLHAGLTRVLKYAEQNKSRRINLITLDGASVSLHTSPLSEGCILLSNRSWT